MKLIKILKTYYLPWLIIFIIAFGLRSCSDIISGEPDKVYDSVLLIISFSFAMAFIIGSILLYANEYWGPKRLAKNLHRAPLVDLQEHGFNLEGNQYRGIYQSYAFIVMYNWMGGKKGEEAIQLVCLFNPTEYGAPISADTFKKLNEKYSEDHLIWDLGTVVSNYGYYFKRPSIDALLDKMSDITLALQFEGLHPLPFEEAKVLNHEELLQQSQNIQSNKIVEDYKKPWIMSYGSWLSIPLMIFVIRALLVFERTFIDFKSLLLPSIATGLLLAITVVWIYRHTKASKANLVLGSFILGTCFGFASFMEINSQFTNSQTQTHQFPLDKTRISENEKSQEVYTYIDYNGLQKQVSFPIKYKGVLTEADSLIIETTKGYFDFEIMKAVEIK